MPSCSLAGRGERNDGVSICSSHRFISAPPAADRFTRCKPASMHRAKDVPHGRAHYWWHVASGRTGVMGLEVVRFIFIREPRRAVHAALPPCRAYGLPAVSIVLRRVDPGLSRRSMECSLVFVQRPDHGCAATFVVQLACMYRQSRGHAFILVGSQDQKNLPNFGYLCPRAISFSSSQLTCKFYSGGRFGYLEWNIPIPTHTGTPFRK
jgi:hypothetical protein